MEGTIVRMHIPSREECLCLFDEIQMPQHIRRHSLMVARIALYLGRLLNLNSIRLNLQLLEAGSLLHDIGKPQSIFSGGRHEELGAAIVENRGYPVVAPIVKEHVSMDRKRAFGPITESIMVNYADKRVKHEQVVTLEDRFYDLMDRYAKNAEHRVLLREKLDLFLELEKRIFSHLTIRPSGTELMDLSLESAREEREYCEQKKNNSGVIGRGEIR
jgi:uncharacterized protein